MVHVYYYIILVSVYIVLYILDAYYVVSVYIVSEILTAKLPGQPSVDFLDFPSRL